MSTLSKRRIGDRVIEAIRSTGAQVLIRNPGQHPLELTVADSYQRYNFRVYFWNITHGGKSRAAEEWRIQVTGIANANGRQEFLAPNALKTIILGWSEDQGLFGAFDYRKHAGELGSSPSIQIREHALISATQHGFGVHNRGNDELAFAFRPDLLLPYLRNFEALHDCGSINDAERLFGGLIDDNVEPALPDLEEEVGQARAFALVNTRRAVRDASFKRRVLGAYGNRCAVCGIQLKLIDAAHILPAAHETSTDETSNGVALCALHHRAYDNALITFDEDYRTTINEDRVREYRDNHLAGGIDRFERDLNRILLLPPDPRDHPNRAMITLANELRGW